MCIKFIVVVCSVILVTNCSLVRQCKLDDTKCMKESSQIFLPKFAGGIPEANVNVLDPLDIKFVDASTPNLKFIITGVVLKGLRNTEVKGIQFDKQKGKLLVKVLVTGNLDGKYEMNGKLFVLPIEGKGDLHVIIRKLLINLEADMFEKLGKDGKNHWVLKAWKHTFELKDRSQVRFENLFPNNELLRKSSEQLMANSGNEVITEIGPPIISAVVAKVVENTAKFFQAIPLEDLVL